MHFDTQGIFQVACYAILRWIAVLSLVGLVGCSRNVETYTRSTLFFDQHETKILVVHETCHFRYMEPDKCFVTNASQYPIIDGHEFPYTVELKIPEGLLGAGR